MFSQKIFEELECAISPEMSRILANTNTRSSRICINKDLNVQKIYNLPLKNFYSEENMSSWRLSRIYKEFKYKKLIPKTPIKSFLVKELYSSQVLSLGTNCCICCEDYEHEDVLRSLSCKHSFHVECIDLWAFSTEKPSCPLCKEIL